MTFVLEIPDDEVMANEAQAHAQGISAQQYARQVLKDGVTPVVGAEDYRPISQLIAEIMADVPPEMLAQVPRDGASQHDHYIYGWPTRDV